MTIASEIQRIEGNISAAYTAADAKGATIPATENSDNLATCIASIQTGSSPTGTIDIFSNGTYDVTNYASASVNTPNGIKANYVITSSDGTNYNIGKLTKDTNNLGVKDTDISIVQFLFYAYENDATIREVSLSSLTTISASAAMRGSFYGCSNLINVDLSGLTTISSASGMDSTFHSCTSLINIDLSNLTTLSGNYACSDAFSGCVGLTSVNLPKLTTLSGESCFSSVFNNCTNISDVYFRALTTSSFGSTYTDQIRNILKNTGTSKVHTLHFPSNLETTIQGLSGYPRFDGADGYVTLAFDLPATS